MILGTRALSLVRISSCRFRRSYYSRAGRGKAAKGVDASTVKSRADANSMHRPCRLMSWNVELL